MAGLSGALLGSTQLDRGFTTKEFLSLAVQLRDLAPASTEFATVPISGFNKPLAGYGSTLEWDRKKAEAAFVALRDDHAFGDGSVDVPPDDQRQGRFVPLSGTVLGCD